MKVIDNKLIKRNNDQIRKERYDLYKKIRKSWVRSPVTKVKQSKKQYKRELTKQELARILKQEDL